MTAPTHRSPSNQPATTPIYQSSAWGFSSLAQAEAVIEGRETGVLYATLGGVPNNVSLEHRLGRLHGSEDVVATAGGMAALDGVFRAHLRPGDRVVASRDLFGLTMELLGDFGRWGVETVYVDIRDHVVVEREVGHGASFLLVETISNPLLRIPDLARLASVAHRHNTLLLVDNTFAGPFHCRPLEHGADLVVESVTKSLAGHNDVVLGALFGSKELVEPTRAVLAKTAGLPTPFAAWLGHRGLATYELRKQRASSNAQVLASWFEEWPEITAVYYPGLDTHADHQLARVYLERGYGSVLSVNISGGRSELEALVAGLETVSLLMTLGGPRTTIAHPASMTHRNLAPDEQQAYGIGESLLRISVGLEPVEDIMDEFSVALRRAFSERRKDVE